MSETVKCWECELEGKQEDMYEIELFDSPFDEAGHLEYFHKRTPKEFQEDYSCLEYWDSCRELLTNTSWADFRYFWCGSCGRYVCRQSPSNGWHSQVRIIGGCEEVCLKCYEEHILECGVPREEVQAGQLPGMFFSTGNPEPKEAGYTCIEEDLFVNDSAKVCKRILTLMDKGYQVVIGYESMSIGGLEGSISLHVKEKSTRRHR